METGMEMEMEMEVGVAVEAGRKVYGMFSALKRKKTNS